MHSVTEASDRRKRMISVVTGSAGTELHEVTAAAGAAAPDPVTRARTPPPRYILTPHKARKAPAATSSDAAAAHRRITTPAKVHAGCGAASGAAVAAGVFARGGHAPVAAFAAPSAAAAVAAEVRDSSVVEYRGKLYAAVERPVDAVFDAARRPASGGVVAPERLHELRLPVQLAFDPPVAAGADSVDSVAASDTASGSTRGSSSSSADSALGSGVARGCSAAGSSGSAAAGAASAGKHSRIQSLRGQVEELERHLAQAGDADATPASTPPLEPSEAPMRVEAEAGAAPDSSGELRAVRQQLAAAEAERASLASSVQQELQLQQESFAEERRCLQERAEVLGQRAAAEEDAARAAVAAAAALRAENARLAAALSGATGRCGEAAEASAAAARAVEEVAALRAERDEARA
eukprot:Rhum_TRINITY_DN9302_c0_g2::Rhum_TRINITY_DN9302_c0_g2_i1::g.32818::m.32818